jgi:DNA-binding transcriptional MocR family regulator
MLPGPAQRIEHPLNAVVVAVHKRIVEDDQRGSSAFGEHGTHGEAQPRVSYAAKPNGHHLWLPLPPQWNRAEFLSHVLRHGLAVVGD